MAKAIFMVPTGEGTGLTSVALGLVHALDRRGIAVGFCKPITQLHTSDTGPERSTQLVKQLANLTPPVPLSQSEAEDLHAQGHEDELLEEVFARYSEAAEGAGIVVVEGLVPHRSASFLTQLNGHIAQALDADVILVTAPGDRTPEQLEEFLEIASQPYGGIHHERVRGCILNLVGAPMDEGGDVRFDYISPPPEDVTPRSPFDYARAFAGIKLFTSGEFELLGCIPWQGELIMPRVRDIVRIMGAEILNEGNLDRRPTHLTVVARHIANYCDHLRTGALAITPGDRDDVLLAVCLAALNGRHIAGLVLTGGFRPSAPVWELCQAGLNTGMPILLVPDETMVALLNLTRINQEVPLDDPERNRRVAQNVASHLSVFWLDALLSRTTELRLSPPAFRHLLVERARSDRQTIVLPEGEEPRTIEAAIECLRRRMADCILLGDPDVIGRVASRRGLTVPDEIRIIRPDDVMERYVQPLVELRKAKGITPEIALDELQDTVVLGTMMLHLGEVDGLVSGAVHTTANTIRPALQLIKTAPGVKRVSSIFFMCLPEQVLVYGDCAVNPDPDPETLAEIAIQSADSASAFGIDPRVAMLSYSTGASGTGSDVEKVREATRIARERRPDLLIDGPLQYDAAAIRTVAQSKAPGSDVAGRATVFVFPDLNTGNTTYKAVQRSADVISMGPMLQGLRKPVNDLSRGALVEDIVFTIGLTAIQAQQVKERDAATAREE